MNEILMLIFSTIGVIAILLAAIGILRMPDFYLRLSVTIKAATIGVGLLLIAAAIFFSKSDVTNRTMAIVLFLFLTAPVAGHMIARSAYISGTKKWSKTHQDDLKGMYDEETHELLSEPKDKNESSKEIY